MKLNALKINATTGVITNEVVEDYTDINRLIGCRCFTTVRLSDTEWLYVDDEGLINGTKTAFSINYGDGYLMGNGVVLGLLPNGESISTKLDANDLRDKYGIKVAVNA